MKYQLVQFANEPGNPNAGYSTNPNYFEITNGKGFYTEDDDEGFNITGYIPEKQVKLIAASRDLLEALKRIGEIIKDHDSKRVDEIVCLIGAEIYASKKATS